MQNNSHNVRHSSRRIPDARSNYRTKKSSLKDTILLILFYPLSFLYFELLLKGTLGSNIFDRYFGYIFLFSFSSGLAVYFLCNLSSKPKLNRILSICTLSVVIFLFLVEFFCKQTFTFFMGLQVIFAATGDVFKSYSVTIISMVLKSLHIVILFLLPLGVYVFLLKKPVSRRISPFYTKIVPLGASILMYVVSIICIFSSSSGIITTREYYRSEFDMTQSSLRFGLLTGFRLDAQYWVFGTPAPDATVTGETDLNNVTVSPSDSGETSSVEPEPSVIEYDYNIMDIDFNSMIAEETDSTLLSMDEYFFSLSGTKQNEYTGLFEGKNLILITAEAFSPYVISKDLTPTLYKLANNGFVFTNYYQPAWGVSTSDGEYSAFTGLVPKSGVNSMLQSADNNMYFTMGNQLSRLGYLTLAYHNNTYTYYSRNLTHPNLGYSKFIAVGNGLEGLTSCWPKSDLEMFQHSVDDYIAKQPFHAYYMTVSGHCNYTFIGNMMAYKNRDAVADMDASEQIKAYIAANLELEYAMEYLVNRLEEAGIADDTVIVLTADHYPYGLEQGFEGNTEDYLNELVGHTVEKNFELHKNTLILWSGCMDEPVVIDEPCYSLDILPTLSNLFGLEYDSRLMIGRDVLSDTTPLVIFRNYSWITDMGYYNATTDTFEATTDTEVSDEYIESISYIVKNKVTFSKYILEKDYYNLLFG